MKKNALSHQVLQDRLRNKMAEIGISAHALEKQAGLKRSAVQNILHGRSKKPSVQILHAITKILGCNINDLLSTPTIASYTSPQLTTTNDTQLNLELYSQAVIIAEQIFQKMQLKPTSTQSLGYIQEIYQYASSHGSSEIDAQFANWLAQKTFLHQQHEA